MNQSAVYFCSRLLLVAALASSAMASPAFFVPGGFANTDADSNGISPLSVGSPFEDGGNQGHGTLQQLYASSEFTPLGSSIFISQIAFRQDVGDSPLPSESVLQNINVYLDTTPQTINGMSATFASNEHAEQLMYSGSVTFDTPFDSGSPRCFCYVIAFSAPYEYKPADGNLLLDIRIVLGNDPNNSSLPTLDYSRTSNVMAVAISYSSATDATGVAGSDQGWATQFGYTLSAQATPEPSSLGLAFAGLGMLALGIFRRRAARRV